MKVFIFIFLFAISAFGKTYHANLYDINSSRQKLLYTLELIVDDQTQLPTKSIFRSSDGTLAADEEVTYEGEQLKTYSYNRYTIKEFANLEVEKNKIKFSRKLKDKEETSEMSLPKDFVVGPLVSVYMKKHWEDLKAGKELVVAYGVLDHFRSVDFTLVKDDKKSKDGLTTIVMKPRSGFIRMFVDSVFFEFRDDNALPERIIGRTLPITVENGKNKDVDAEMVFQKNP